ncbi:MAG: protein kinase [bacterium]
MIGKTISHYEILEKLGAGGMGVVYKAQDTKLDRFVALKFLPPHLSQSEEEKKRFIHEAKAASALDHPNICTIYEIDETEDGQMFIAMACYEGESLKDRIERGPLPLDECIDIAIQAAQGLAKAHSKKIIHRDIKPANILLTEDGQIKIVDFGLAKLAGRTMLTKEGATLGTVAYMSPEQAQGEQVDHRTDIWALGAVLYEMVTGRQPFAGDYEQAVVYSIINEDPEPLTGLRSDVPMALEQVVNKCLDKNPEERYQHVDEMPADFRSLRKELEPGKKVEDSISLRSSRRKRVNIFGGFVGLFLIAVVILYFFFPQKPSSSNRKSIAVLPFANMSGDPENEYFSDGITDDIIAQLSKIRSLKVISRTSVMQYKERKDKNLRQIGNELNVATVLEGSVRRVGNRVRIVAQLIDARFDEHLWSETYDREMTHVFAIQSDVAEHIAVALQAELSPEEKERIERKPTEDIEAYDLYLLGRYHLNKRSDQGISTAIGYFEKAIARDSGYAVAYAGLADAYTLGGIGYSASPPKDAMPKAMAAAIKALELDKTLPEAHTSLAYVRLWDWDWSAAKREFERAIELNPSHVQAHQWYAQYLIRARQFEAALAAIKRARDLDPLSVVINTEMAWPYFYMGDYDQAIEQNQRVLAMDPDFFMAHYNLGNCYERKGLYKAALAEYQKAVTLSGGAPFITASRARAYAASGRRDEALKLLDELIERSSHGSAVSLYIAMVYEALGEKEQAFEWLEKAFVDREAFVVVIGTNWMPFESLRSDPRFKALLGKIGLGK